MASAKRRKSYDLKYKLDAVEYAEMNSNEKAAKKFQVGNHVGLHCECSTFLSYALGSKAFYRYQ